mmetsp:Transcript_136732/g.323970  ORF Transcript_136732/g.323970 Transcript_136732/m.323970 type:complete len:310 (-) Transcript_136732:186-1115(-)
MGAMAASTAFFAATRPSLRSSKVMSTLSPRPSTSCFTSCMSAANLTVAAVVASSTWVRPGDSRRSSFSRSSSRKASTSAAGASCKLLSSRSDFPSREVRSVSLPLRVWTSSACAFCSSACRSFQRPSPSIRVCSSASSRDISCAADAFMGASPPKLTSEKGPGDWLPSAWLSWPVAKRLSRSQRRSERSSTTSRCSATASSFSCSAVGRATGSSRASVKVEASFSRAKSKLPSASRRRAARSATCEDSAPTFASTSVVTRMAAASSFCRLSMRLWICFTCCCQEEVLDSELDACCFSFDTCSTSSQIVF